jgi:hypothetical protein
MGCAYTGIAGGATVIEMPTSTCAGAEIGISSEPNIKRSKNPR